MELAVTQFCCEGNMKVDVNYAPWVRYEIVFTIVLDEILNELSIKTIKFDYK